ncbi:MAG TPA: PPOX class F420-dependent oxidoreductase [Gaiellaceae bacterium]|jgi:PPOX class probable F420-dependent enzyme|nr:PPOX class F420-dependent oxidoreductase [Gaiellaceae bacterium]
MPALTAKQLSLLRGPNFGVVATVDDRGRPQTSVVWVDTDGENVIFNTTNARAKGRNLRSNPQVSISVWDNEDPYRYFEVEGPAELDENGAAEHIHSLAQRYYGRQFHAPVDRVIVRISPRRIFDHGTDD